MPRNTLNLPRFFSASSFWMAASKASGSGRMSSAIKALYLVLPKNQLKNDEVYNKEEELTTDFTNDTDTERKIRVIREIRGQSLSKRRPFHFGGALVAWSLLTRSTKSLY